MLCPICRKKVESTDLFMPFCSDRCRVQDLANWSTGKYVISGPSQLEDDEFDSGTARPDEDED